MEVSLSSSENFPLEPRTHASGTGNKTATTHWQIERRAGYSAHGRAGGLIVFDHKGRLVKADPRAATMLSTLS